jgi:hypothetical protein
MPLLGFFSDYHRISVSVNAGIVGERLCGNIVPFLRPLRWLLAQRKGTQQQSGERKGTPISIGLTARSFCL